MGKIILKLHKHGQTMADENYLVENVQDLTKLMSLAEKKYNQDKNVKISFFYFLDGYLIKISDDDDYRNFLRIYKDKNKVVQVHLENKREKELRGLWSKLRPEATDELTVQQFERINVSPIKKMHIKNKINGTFLIAYCDDDKDFKSGVKKDVKMYQQIANMLGFSYENVVTLKNPTRTELLQYFDTYSDGDHRAEECFIFAFSGHGGIKANYQYPDGSHETRWVGEYIFLKDDTTVTIQELVRKLKQCKLPTEAPKIMFIDASRGCHNEKSNRFEDLCDFSSEDTTTTNMENIILAYSTIPNYRSFTGIDGSVFTKYLHKKISENERKDSPIEFHQLLTEVNELVVKEHIYLEEQPPVESGQITMKPVRQMPCFRSSFCNELYFFLNVSNVSTMAKSS